jgi:thioredoxin 1
MIEVIKFGATWCHPCSVMAPAMNSLKTKYNIEGSDIQITDMDVDLNPEMASLHKIKNIPVTIFKSDGIEIKRVVGVLSLDKMEEIINEVNITK